MSNITQKYKERHYFFLNFYKKYAFTRCPKCEMHTKLRKYCLLIHIEPHQLISLNKTTRHCPSCDLIIVKKEELEQLLYTFCEKRSPEIIGDEYLVLGTMERKDWEKGLHETMEVKEALDSVYLFKGIWSFEIEPGGWIYAPDKRHHGNHNHTI